MIANDALFATWREKLQDYSFETELRFARDHISMESSRLNKTYEKFWDSFSPKVALSKVLSPSYITYVSYSRGHK